MEIDRIRFASRFNPRDARDLLRTIPLTVLLVVELVVLPTLLLGWLLDDLERGLGIVAGIVLVGFCVLSLSTVRHVTVSDEGIVFQRYLGAPRLISWERISRIAEASRSEVFFRVWIWPGIPPRGSILCMSIRHQFRINWDDGCYYFPPDDVQGFVRAVGQHHSIEQAEGVDAAGE